MGLNGENVTKSFNGKNLQQMTKLTEDLFMKKALFVLFVCGFTSRSTMFQSFWDGYVKVLTPGGCLSCPRGIYMYITIIFMHRLL